MGNSTGYAIESVPKALGSLEVLNKPDPKKHQTQTFKNNKMIHMEEYLSMGVNYPVAP